MAWAFNLNILKLPPKSQILRASPLSVFYNFKQTFIIAYL
nr:MAG TPA: hypothetical protein [Caudoviricetes sp.]